MGGMGQKGPKGGIGLGGVRMGGTESGPKVDEILDMSLG